MAEMKGARSEGDRASRMRDQRAKMLAEMEKAKDKIRQEIHGMPVYLLPHARC